MTVQPPDIEIPALSDRAASPSAVEFGGFVHHLRNALTPIVHHLAFLSRSEAIQGDDRLSLEAARRAAARAANLLEQTVAAIGGALRREEAPFSVDETLRSLAEWARDARPDGAIVLREPLPAYVTRGAGSYLRLAAENLCHNAFEAGARTVTVALAVAATGASATITFTDDGPGIPAAMASTLLQQPQVSGKADGHGLGLYLSRQLVELLGGTLMLDATGPSGTRFAVTLPGRAGEARR